MKYESIFIKAIISIIVCFSSIFAQSKIIIPDDYPTIQQGIDIAQDGDTVLVKEGTYTEQINYNGKKLIVCSLFINDTDEIHIKQTIITAPIGGAVIFDHGESEEAKLIGFTINNGTGSGSWPNINSGGVTINNNSNPILSNLIISDNLSDYGGGIFINNSSPTIRESIIENNVAFGSGGGIVGYLSSPTIESTIIRNNTIALYNGGGVYCYGGKPVFNNVVIENNTGVYGGGVLFWNSEAGLVHCKIIGNLALDSGGGVHIYDNSKVTIQKTLIADNESYNEGGGVAMEVYSATLFDRVTIANNSIGSFGGGVSLLKSSTATFINTVLWKNENDEISFFDYSEPNSVLLFYSTVTDGESSIHHNNNGYTYYHESNISTDPLFTTNEISDYFLSQNSPCIDKGTVLIDFQDGQYSVSYNLSADEFNGSSPDMGAYETNYNLSGHNDESEINNEFSLSQNYPNPFNPSTKINYSIAASGRVTIKVYDLLGNLVDTILDENMSAGSYNVNWTPQNLASGMYIYRIKSGNYIESKKLILLK